MSEEHGSSTQICSFCHRTHDQVDRLIASPDDVYICDECVLLCVEILDEEREQEAQELVAGGVEDLPAPREISRRLEEYVICLLYTSDAADEVVPV